MANYLQELAQDAVCQCTCHMTGLWFLPARSLRLNTNEWMNHTWSKLTPTSCPVRWTQYIPLKCLLHLTHLMGSLRWSHSYKNIKLYYTLSYCIRTYSYLSLITKIWCFKHILIVFHQCHVLQTSDTNIWGGTTKCIIQVHVIHLKSHFINWDTRSWSATHNSDKSLQLCIIW